MHRLLLHETLQPKGMEPNQSRNIRYPMVRHSDHQKARSIQPLLRNECPLYLWLQERLEFQRLQPKVQRDNEKCTVDHPNCHHLIDQSLR